MECLRQSGHADRIPSRATSSSTRSRSPDRRRARTGWRPLHLVVERDGAVEGILPLYLKNHSQGEYVFDHAWADALERAGGDYYPKLQASVPFTPATGRRFLIAKARRDATREALLAAGRDGGEGAEGLVAAHHLPDRGGMARGGRRRLSAAHRPAIPLGEPRLCELRPVPRRAFVVQAQEPAQGARGGARGGRRIRLAHRPRHHRGALGHVLRILHGHRRAQMGPSLSHARLLQPRRRRAWASRSCS